MNCVNRREVTQGCAIAAAAEINGSTMLSAQRGDHRNNTCSAEVFLHVLPFLMGMQKIPQKRGNNQARLVRQPKQAATP